MRISNLEILKLFDFSDALFPKKFHFAEEAAVKIFILNKDVEQKLDFRSARVGTLTGGFGCLVPTSDFECLVWISNSWVQVGGVRRKVEDVHFKFGNLITFSNFRAPSSRKSSFRRRSGGQNFDSEQGCRAKTAFSDYKVWNSH